MDVQIHGEAKLALEFLPFVQYRNFLQALLSWAAVFVIWGIFTEDDALLLHFLHMLEKMHDTVNLLALSFLFIAAYYLFAGTRIKRNGQPLK